jgi:pyruvate/2-oxoacid:ferredoxin oxidoreductase alpha subunit
MGKILMKGNEAIGEAAIKAGCLNYFAYPITPQSEVAKLRSVICSSVLQDAEPGFSLHRRVPA